MALNPQRDLFNNTGIKYEEAFGHDEGFRQFVSESLDRLPPGASILELGSGTGKPVADMAVRRGFRLHGVDFSPVMVELSRQQVPQATFEEANILEFQPEPGTRYDGVFAFFSLFHMSRDEMSLLIRRWADWINPGGFVFVGTMVADDFATTPEMFDADGHYAHGVEHTFMGRRVGNIFYSKKGWNAMLDAGGFRVIGTNMVPFQAPPKAECDLEPHYYITAKRVG